MKKFTEKYRLFTEKGVEQVREHFSVYAKGDWFFKDISEKCKISKLKIVKSKYNRLGSHLYFVAENYPNIQTRIDIFCKLNNIEFDIKKFNTSFVSADQVDNN